MCQWEANRNSRSGYRIPQTERSQIGDHRLNTSCGVVERPDHHCGDNLPNRPEKKRISKLNTIHCSHLTDFYRIFTIGFDNFAFCGVTFRQTIDVDDNAENDR